MAFEDGRPGTAMQGLEVGRRLEAGQAVRWLPMVPRDGRFYEWRAGCVVDTGVAITGDAWESKSNAQITLCYAQFTVPSLITADGRYLGTGLHRRIAGEWSRF